MKIIRCYLHLAGNLSSVTLMKKEKSNEKGYESRFVTIINTIGDKSALRTFRCAMRNNKDIEIPYPVFYP